MEKHRKSKNLTECLVKSLKVVEDQVSHAGGRTNMNLDVQFFSRLLDILAQRKDPRGLKEGLVLLDNEKPPEDFRLMSGYVVQVCTYGSSANSATLDDLNSC